MGRDGGPIRSDDVDRATEALRESPVPPGPPPHLVDATLAAVRRGRPGVARPHRPETTCFQRIRDMNLIAKIAAAFLLAACGAAVLMVVTRGTGQSPRADRKRIWVSPPAEPPGRPT